MCDTINTVILKCHDMTGMNSIEILLVLKLWFKRAFKSTGTIVTSCYGEVFAPRSEDARPDGSNCKRRAFSSEITSFGRCYGHSLALSVLAFNNTVCTKWNAAPRSTVRSSKLRPICGVFVAAVPDLYSFLGAFAWSRKALRSCVLSVFSPSVREHQRAPTGCGTFMDICRGTQNLVKIRWTISGAGHPNLNTCYCF
jgi:hypothetical protein